MKSAEKLRLEYVMCISIHQFCQCITWLIYKNSCGIYVYSFIEIFLQILQKFAHGLIIPLPKEGLFDTHVLGN